MIENVFHFRYGKLEPERVLSAIHLRGPIARAELAALLTRGQVRDWVPMLLSRRDVEELHGALVCRCEECRVADYDRRSWPLFFFDDGRTEKRHPGWDPVIMIVDRPAPELATFVDDPSSGPEFKARTFALREVRHSVHGRGWFYAESEGAYERAMVGVEAALAVGMLANGLGA